MSPVDNQGCSTCPATLIRIQTTIFRKPQTREWELRAPAQPDFPSFPCFPPFPVFKGPDPEFRIFRLFRVFRLFQLSRVQIRNSGFSVCAAFPAFSGFQGSKSGIPVFPIFSGVRGSQPGIPGVTAPATFVRPRLARTEEQVGFGGTGKKRKSLCMKQRKRLSEAWLVRHAPGGSMAS